MQKNDKNPLVVGGVGGSGTRLVAELLMDLGIYIGNDLNIQNDNLLFTYLFKRLAILDTDDNEFENLLNIFLKTMHNRPLTTLEIEKLVALSLAHEPRFSAKWVAARLKAFSDSGSTTHTLGNWGWKEPNTQIVVDRLYKFLPEMKYIHVVRNGLDMVHSKNHIQAKLWGKYFLGSDYDGSPSYVLKYWCYTHRRMLAFGDTMGDHFLWLKFDDLCQKPEKGIQQILSFLGMKISNTQFQQLVARIKIPKSIGRFKQHGLDIFDNEDVAFVASLGFDTSLESFLID